MENKKEKENKSGITYLQYLAAVVIIIALSVMITITLVGCSLDAGPAIELDEDRQDINSPLDPDVEYKVCYIPTKGALSSFSSGTPIKLWLGDIVDGKLTVKIEFEQGETEVKGATFVGNTLSINNTNESCVTFTAIDEITLVDEENGVWEKING